MASGTSWGSGPGMAARGPSTGRMCSPRSRTGASPIAASWSVTGSPGCLTPSLAYGPKPSFKTCVVHLIRGSFRYASRRDWTAIAKDLKPIYTAPTEAAAHDRLAEFAEAWEAKYPAIVRLWESAWAEFVPFLSFAPDVREVIYTTNSIESVNARIRRAVKARGHFPTATAALKCVYLALMSLDATGTAKKRWNNRWKAALNAFSVAFPGRILTTTK